MHRLLSNMLVACLLFHVFVKLRKRFLDQVGMLFDGFKFSQVNANVRTEDRNYKNDVRLH